MITTVINMPIRKKYRSNKRSHYVGEKVCTISERGLIDGIDTSIKQKEIERKGYGIGVFRTGNTYYGFKVISYK